MPKDIKLLEKQLCKNSVYKGAVNFNADRVLLQNGKTAVREYIDHPGAVAIVPIIGDNIVLVRQYRYPVGEPTWEIPAGKMHKGHDKPLRRVRCELKEETGYTARTIRKLISFWPCCAFSNEVLHIYVAENMRAGRPSPDDDEFLKVESVPFTAALEMILSGKIKDSKTIIALQALALERKTK